MASSCTGIGNNCSANSISTTSATTTTTTASNWASALGWLIYTDFLYGYLYFLVAIAPVGLLLNLTTLAAILWSAHWSNPAKDHYLYNAGLNIFLSMSIDVLVTMLRGLTIFLNNNGNYNANLQVDNLNAIVCVGHNYVNPVLEFVWMWNAVNFR